MTHSGMATLSSEQKRLIAYWRERSRDGQPPKRSGIHPKDLKEFLPNLSIVQSTPDDFVFRLSGSSLRDMFGADLRGRFVNDLGEHHSAWTKALRDCLSQGIPAHGIHNLSNGRIHVWIRLPLADKDGETNMALCYDLICRPDDLGDDDDASKFSRSARTSSTNQTTAATSGRHLSPQHAA